MKKFTVYVIFGMFLIVGSMSHIIIPADAAKTGSYNFCSVFPGYPECSGWRTEAITDNHWFCEYVHINVCSNPPNPEKQIIPRDIEYCCKFIGTETEIKKQEIEIVESNETPSDKVESIEPLIIWTNKDHYNYRDKVILYGKFDFSNPTIVQNVEQLDFDQTGEKSINSAVDVRLNGHRVLKEIPISPNGWFATFFFHDNIYRFSTQDNLIEVEYIVSAEDIPPGGPKTHATYHFTTGEIVKKDESFEMWLDDSSLPNEIKYGVTVENPELFINLMRQDFVKTRLVTPEGYVIPVESVFSVSDLSTTYDGFKQYGYGMYQLQITYGENTAKTQFEFRQ